MRAFTITLAALGLALTVLGAGYTEPSHLAVSPDSVHLTPTTDHKPSSIHIALIVQTSRPATACELALDMKPAGMVWLIPGACRNFWDDPRIATGRIVTTIARVLSGMIAASTSSTSRRTSGRLALRGAIIAKTAATGRRGPEWRAHARRRAD
ncbi:hypothetical protein BU23DRAFT_570482 [Bimuria novae-zelandiae CBS 107.79]|uniref:Uncharacterized protein n=1 Tax=Bimuria novae-zelandiae CBS 107.79 TaxID=1447943 RepID=A0A6A5VC40_9PLEO|nr:hypothetical protein BU23DRAFT_570482 [Bimuria novae-zelandiae CBS 107.79]